MRKYQQRQILELLKTFEEAQSAGLLGACQDGAVKICEFIEGQGTQTVALLEEYCELLYKASVGEISKKWLRKQLIQIENSVKSELKPNKLEIAFLSYNASMSDSIESIYLAAKADPDCDTYWIPVPYFERKADGSLGTMHYEGEECYGDNIECTDWREYDIEVRHPDVIFTFNPYDGVNYVTSVHPDFYCKRLRNLTDLLIYVPYFVTVGDVQEHFCTTAGCMFAHKVIVESNKICDTYIRVFKKAFGDRFGKPEDKFIALGSPKFDKVISTKREDCRLPDKWRELIGDKKVVFYNTTVVSILVGNEQYLKKLRSALDIFRSRDDVVLWWRPHPLNEATISSMRPQLLVEYEQIIEDYKREGWGIYDDTPNLHSAIAWSDAYYGDWSSLVSMYQLTGKPIMIVDVNEVSGVEKSENSAHIEFDNVCDYGGYYWVAATNYNGLFRIDKQTLKARYMGSFPNEAPLGRLYNYIVARNGKLFFAPAKANSFAVYDIDTATITQFPIRPPANTVKYDENNKFSVVVSYKECVYFLGNAYPAIVKTNVSTLETEYFENCFPDSDNSLRHFRNVSVLESTLTAIHRSSQKLIELNLDTMEYETKLEFDGKRMYFELSQCGDYYYTPQENGKSILKINRQSYRDIKDIPVAESFVRVEMNYYSASYGDNIWLLPLYMENRPLKINTTTDEIVVAPEFDVGDEEDFSNMSGKIPGYIGVRKHGCKLLAFSRYSKKLIEYDCEKSEVRKEMVYLDMSCKESVKAIKRSIIKNSIGNWAMESELLSVNDFISVVMDTHHDGSAEQEIRSGELIYTECKRMVMTL